MPYVTTSYSRAELHEKVWARPMSQVAKDFGVSDVALKKVCRKLNVPTPTRGYWAKKRAGQKVQPTPLPKLKEGEPESHKVTRWVDPPPGARSPIDKALDARPDLKPELVRAPFEVLIPTTLHQPHALVRTTREHLTKQAPYRGLVEARGSQGLPVSVSPTCLHRALVFLDGLIKAVEKGGGSVQLFDPSRRKETRFILGGEEVEFRLNERVRQVPHVPTARERQLGTSGPKWDLEPRGVLVFSIGSVYSAQKWEERQGKDETKLEAQATRIFEAILQTVENKKASARAAAERARLEREEEHRRLLIEQERQRQRTLDETVIQMTRRWIGAEDIRAFAEHVRKDATSRFGSIAPQSPASEWLQRAARVAAGLDPTEGLFNEWAGRKD